MSHCAGVFAGADGGEDHRVSVGLSVAVSGDGSGGGDGMGSRRVRLSDDVLMTRCRGGRHQDLWPPLFGTMTAELVPGADGPSVMVD